jgi:hypothetical protein
VKTVKGVKLWRVSWPGLASYWLTNEQREVVRVLLCALVNSPNPNVGQHNLLKAIGSSAKRLSEVFARSKAWGTLVIPGARLGTFRLPDPPDVPDVA